MRRDPYYWLGWLAMIATPFAAVFFFGWRVYTAVMIMTDDSIWLAIPTGIATAAGLEAVGVFAGHVAMEFWRRGDFVRARLAAFIMAIYVGVGVYELWDTIGMIMFIIAPLVYVLVALRHSLDAQTEEGVVQAEREAVAEEAEKQRRHERDMAEQLFKQNMDAKDREHDRLMKEKRLEVKTAVQLAQLEATKTQQDSDEKRDELTNLDAVMLTDWRSVPDALKRKFATATREEQQEMFPHLDGRKLRDWRRYAMELVAETAVAVNGRGAT